MGNSFPRRDIFVRASSDGLSKALPNHMITVLKNIKVDQLNPVAK
jgi:hypothetical protein